MVVITSVNNEEGECKLNECGVSSVIKNCKG